MDIPIQAILFLGIIPALILLFLSIKGYEGYYKEKTMFLTFVIGIILGVVAALIRIFVPFIPFEPFSIILFASFDQLFKTIILNTRSLQGKKETTIYGLTLGLGFGSSFVPYLIIVGSVVGSTDISYLALISIGSMGYILFHAASGLLIGYGISINNLIKYLGFAIIIQIPFNIIADFADPRFPIESYISYFQLVIVIFGAIYFYYVVNTIMPKIREKRKNKKTNIN